jgi:hypothetical protein
MPPGTSGTGLQTGRTIPLKTILPTIIQRPADPQITARLADVANPGSINHGVKPKLVYTISEGHNSPPFCLDNKKDKRNDPLLLSKN